MTKHVTLLLAVVVAACLAVGAVFALRSPDESDGPDNAAHGEPSEEPFTPKDAAYRLVIPSDLVAVPVEEDTSIPSAGDLALELEDAVGQGGLIRVGRLSGPAAGGTYEQVGRAASQDFADQYEGHPDLWGTGASVESGTVQVADRDAIEINARFSPSGDAEPSTYFRIYFVEAPLGPPLLVTCDWNVDQTTAIDAACTDLVASMEVAS